MLQITYLYLYIFHFKNIKLNFKLMNNIFDLKIRGLQQQICLRKATERDCHESVCRTWLHTLGHRFFILIFDNYIHIWNESIYNRIKVLIKFVCKLLLTFYFHNLIQFFTLRTKIPLRPWKTAIAQPP